MVRRFGLFLIAVLLVFLTLQSRTPAQSNYNLQADINQLRLQVSQLQAQVAQLAGRQGAPPSTRTVPRTSQPSPYLSDRQMLDRLAVLAIEAKDRMNALEARIARLEKRPQ